MPDFAMEYDADRPLNNTGGHVADAGFKNMEARHG